MCVWQISTLVGWIPEHIEIKRCGQNITMTPFLYWPIYSSTFEREKTWERVEKGFSAGEDARSLVSSDLIIISGLCVVTLGTGPASCVRWRDIPLLPSHSYAVIGTCALFVLADEWIWQRVGAYEAEAGRLLTVLDSWVRSSEDQSEPSSTYIYLFVYPHLIHSNRSASDTLVRHPKHLLWNLSQLGPQNVGETVEFSWVTFPFQNSGSLPSYSNYMFERMWKRHKDDGDGTNPFHGKPISRMKCVT